MQVSVPIYKTPTGRYTAYTVAWRVNGHRSRKKFAKLKEARAFAKDIAANLVDGKHTGDLLTYDQTREYREAKAITGDIIEAARQHAKRKAYGACTVTMAVRDLMASRRAEIRRRPFNPDYLRNLEQRLETFASAFQVNIEQISADQIQAWLNDLDVGLRTKNNYFGDIRALVHWCVKQKRLPRDFDELDRVNLQRAGPGRIQPYTPEEATTILEHAQNKADDWLPYLPVRMFSGIRGQEAMRLHQSSFHKQWIAADADITKTEARRLIPILPNLKAWLREYKPTDALSPKPDTARTCPALTRLIRAAGVEPRNNGFRDSYVSYRMAELRDAAKVSEETGHSARQLRRSYMELRLPDKRVITPGLAKDYFGIKP